MFTIPHTCAVALTGAGETPADLNVPAGHLAELLGPAVHTLLRAVDAGEAPVGLDTVLEMFARGTMSWWQGTQEAAVRGWLAAGAARARGRALPGVGTPRRRRPAGGDRRPEVLWFYKVGEYTAENTPDGLLEDPAAAAAWLDEWSPTLRGLPKLCDGARDHVWSLMLAEWADTGLPCCESCAALRHIPEGAPTYRECWGVSLTPRRSVLAWWSSA
jgi:hypothetical protein